jgi:hypothetical protein
MRLASGWHFCQHDIPALFMHLASSSAYTRMPVVIMAASIPYSWEYHKGCWIGGRYSHVPRCTGSHVALPSVDLTFEHLRSPVKTEFVHPAKLYCAPDQFPLSG